MGVVLMVDSSSSGQESERTTVSQVPDGRAVPSANIGLDVTSEILENTSDHLYVIDPGGSILRWNAGCVRTYQYTERDAIGMDVRDIIPETHIGQFNAIISQSVAGRSVTPIDSVRVTRSGAMRHVILTTAPMLDEHGKPHSIIFSERDVTEVRQIQQHAREREARLDGMVEEASDGIVTINAKGIILSVNPAIERLFGYTKEELAGENVSMLMPSPYRDEHDGYLARYLLTGRAKIIGVGRQVVGVRKDGSEFPVDLAVTRHSVGDETLFTGFLRDISARLEAEREMLDTAAALELSNHALQKAMGDAENASRTKSEFLANMSHEIRTPMTAIMGFADIVREGISAGASREDLTEAINTVTRNGQYLLQIINDILDLSKIESERLDLEDIEFDLPQMLLDIRGLMQVRADAKGLSFDVYCVGPLPKTIRSDPTRLKQILINLIGNAIKFTENGSVKVVTRMSEEGDQAHTLQWDVVDTGIGIDAAKLNTVFEPFKQADQSTTRVHGGTGLGLCICKRLAVILGGDVEIVRSTPGVGTTFRLNTNIACPEDAEMFEHDGPLVASECDPGPSVTPVESNINARVLLVEDGPDNQRLIQHLLRRIGVQVEVSENGQVACDRILEEGEVFDVVLMDMQMPVMDGYTATKRLRSAGFDRPIVAMTAHAMSGDRDKCLKAGCNDYLTKPLGRQDLYRKLADHVSPQCSVSA